MKPAGYEPDWFYFQDSRLATRCEHLLAGLEMNTDLIRGITDWPGKIGQFAKAVDTGPNSEDAINLSDIGHLDLS